MYKIGWFSSGRGAGSQSLLTTVMDNIQTGRIKAHIEFVYCNREAGQSDETDKFHSLVRSFDIPLVSYSSKYFQPELRKEDIEKWRNAYDLQVIAKLDKYDVDICVLAGYMLVTGSNMCKKYDQLNLHPAVPGGPKGTWKDVIWQLIETKASHTGAMMHLATPELDEGPPVTYCKFSIRGSLFDEYWREISGVPVSKIKATQGEDNNLFKSIRKYGLIREYPLIVTTLKAFSEGRVKIDNGSVVDKEGCPIEAYDLSQEIDKGLLEKGLI